MRAYKSYKCIEIRALFIINQIRSIIIIKFIKKNSNSMNCIQCNEISSILNHRAGDWWWLVDGTWIGAFWLAHFSSIELMQRDCWNIEKMTSVTIGLFITLSDVYQMLTECHLSARKNAIVILLSLSWTWLYILKALLT